MVARSACRLVTVVDHVVQPGRLGQQPGQPSAPLPPTLAVAGSYLDGIGVPACVGAAGRAVTSVIEALDAQVAR